MSIFKCKMCGGELDIVEGSAIAKCLYCRTKQTVPKTMDENVQNIFNRANILRLKSEFDKAEALYEKIIQADDTQAEAYWGLILCKYGIEYVDDPATERKIPTCHRASYDSIIADDDYKSAVANADADQRVIYEEQANEIDRIQKEILALARREEKYDVFICYKETDVNGNRTQDSVIANDIYYQLTNEGFKVFYAAITLEGKLGSAYEPIIFAALNSAKVMLTIGTKLEYFNAVWVRNEWSRFLKIIQKDRSKLLIPCYRDMDAYELPDEFAHLQAQDMSKIGFINDVVRGIKKVVSKTETVIPTTPAEKVKYCVACLTECGADMKFCFSCGKTEFAETKKEAELTKKLNSLINQENFSGNSIITEQTTVNVTKNNFIYEIDGNEIKFGSYPQSKVTDSALINVLNKKAATLPTSLNSYAWTSYKYYIDKKVSDFMWYIDVEQGGENYRGVYFMSYRPYYPNYEPDYTYQSENGYKLNTVYWFKYEPISWTVLSKNDQTAFVCCDTLIDSQQFDFKGGENYSNNYAESTIRRWLNQTFYDTAFSEVQKQCILTTMVDNGMESTGYSLNEYACANTQDKIFLLSHKDVTNSSYGFLTDENVYDPARKKRTTDYAQAQGAYISSDESDAGNGDWWLRSPSYLYSSFAYIVECSGDACDDFDVCSTGFGVVPALWITL